MKLLNVERAARRNLRTHLLNPSVTTVVRTRKGPMANIRLSWDPSGNLRITMDNWALLSGHDSKRAELLEVHACRMHRILEAASRSDQKTT